MVYIFLAEGFETVEALAPLDLLRRAGVNSLTVSITDKREVTSKQGITVKADAVIEEIDPSKAIMFVLPGGLPGADNLFACKKLCDMLKQANEDGKYLAAICAAPYILGQLGLLEGKRAVCYPGFEDKLTGAKICHSRAVSDHNVITAVGMGASIEFGLHIVSSLCGRERAGKIGASVLAK